MDDELKELDLELKGYLVANKIDELLEVLNRTTDENIIAILDENWAVMKKYYESGNFELIFRHIKFVAYTCFLVEYAHQRSLMDDQTFAAMMAVYEDINNQKSK